MHIVSTTSELDELCSRLTQSSFITVDTEFMRDSTYWPKLCLIQVAGEEDACIIDPLSDEIDLGSFYALMRDPSVLKVFHAARQDIEIFHHQGQAIPTPLFDTQVAAMVCGFGESASYETLVRELAKEQLDKSSRFTDWSRRPLSQKQLRYALDDVTHLRTVYEALMERLSANGRQSWLEEEVATLQAPATYDLTPDDAWRRLKSRYRGRRGLAVLIEIAAWREREAQSRNVPRSRVLKDDALYEIATQLPDKPEALNQLRAVPNGFASSRAGQSLMTAIEAGLSRPESEIPKPARAPVLPQGIGPVVELLKVLLKQRCETHGVAQKLVATVSDLEQIAADDKADVAALAGWRRKMFGKDALRLKRGEIALAAKDRQIVVFEISDSEFD